jgi:hypothetical protein
VGDELISSSQVKPDTFWTGFKRGLKFFLEDMASFNNFLLLTLTYFIGVGISSVLMKISTKSKSKSSKKIVNTYWDDIDIGAKNVDSYFRPF